MTYQPSRAAMARQASSRFGSGLAASSAILQAMANRGIACGIHYPIPVHLQQAYRFLGHRKGSFPVAERCAEEFLSLPMYPELTTMQSDAVVHELKTLLRASKRVYERVV